MSLELVWAEMRDLRGALFGWKVCAPGQYLLQVEEGEEGGWRSCACGRWLEAPDGTVVDREQLHDRPQPLHPDLFADLEAP